MGAARYDIRADQFSQTQIGVGYIDDCLILALNYITDYAYSGSVSVNHTFMVQVSLRTLGGNVAGQSASGAHQRDKWPAALNGRPGGVGAAEYRRRWARRGGCREGD